MKAVGNNSVDFNSNYSVCYESNAPPTGESTTLAVLRPFSSLFPNQKLDMSAVVWLTFGTGLDTIVNKR